jgi:hypothetical protein
MGGGIYKSDPIEIWASATLAAGAADTVSSAFKLTLAGGTLMLKLVNGATGPTVAAEIQPQVSYQKTGKEWFELTSPEGASTKLTGGTGNNEAKSRTVEIPKGALFVRLVAGSNTVQDVSAYACLVETHR